MTGIPAVCVAICASVRAAHPPARPVTMPAFPARLTCNSVLSRSRPNRPVPTGKDTANAVGLYGPPGFKSPISAV